MKRDKTKTKIKINLLSSLLLPLLLYFPLPTFSNSVPGEFEAQESIWLAWPMLEPQQGKSNIPQIKEIISALSDSDEYIDLIVNDEKEKRKALIHLASIKHKHKNKIRFHFIKHSDFWLRDTGAIFIRNEQGQLASVSLNFNSWGMAPHSQSFKIASQSDSQIGKKMADEMKIPHIKSSFLVAEGGALEFNGKGTLITTESVILQTERNPSLTKTKAEEELKNLFGLKNIIWLKKGIKADDSVFYGPIKDSKKNKLIFTALTTNGHTDEFVRFVNEDTVLLAEVTEEEAKKSGKDSIAFETRKRLEENYEILKSSKNQDGKPLKIIRIPAAEEIYKTLKSGDGTYDALSDMEGSFFPLKNQATFVSASSYLNYIVANKVLLIPQYWKNGRPSSIKVKDEKAKNIIQQAFPDRKVIVIKNVEDINIGGGGIHCISQQMPK